MQKESEKMQSERTQQERKSENDKLEKCHCSKVKDYQPPELNELGEEWGK